MIHLYTNLLIAATTILAGAELGTAGFGDFAPFEPHRLKLFSAEAAAL